MIALSCGRGTLIGPDYSAENYQGGPMRLNSLLLCAGALLSIASLSGAALAQRPPTQSPSVSKNVEEVSVDVAAYDKTRPVLDLSSQDLQITDAGVPVPISSFHLQNREDAAKLVTLVFDRVDSTGRRNALKITSEVLKSIPEPGFEFSVLSVQDALRLHQEFTSDRSLVTRAADEATGDLAKALPSVAARVNDLIAAAKSGRDTSGHPLTAEQRLAAQAMLGALEDSRYIVNEQHMRPSLAALLALVRSEGNLPGRKIIFYITQDPDTDIKDQPLLSRIIANADPAEVEIFAFDANATNAVSRDYLEAFAAVKMAMSVRENTGMQGTVDPQTAAQTSAPTPPPSVQAPSAPLLGLGDIKTAGMTDFDRRHYDFLEIPERHLSSSACRIATYTGGACFQAGEDPEKTIRQAAEDIGTYYAVTFVPTVKQYDGKFHGIKIKPVRRGVKVRSRSGYFAVPPEAELGAQRFEAPLLDLLSKPNLPSDFQFESRVLQLGEVARQSANVLLLEVPLTQLETREDANTNVYTVQVSVLTQVKDASGQVVDYFADDIPQHGSLEQLKQGEAANVYVERPFLAAPGEYTLEIAVMDRNSGKASARRSTIQIADTSRTPYLSDLSLVGRTEPLPPETAPAEPLRYGMSKIVPELATDLPKEHKQISIFSIVSLDASEPAQPRLAVKLVKDDKTLAEVPLPLPASEERGMGAHLATIDTSSLPAGNYQIVETLTQGAAVTEKSAAFRIDASPIATSPEGASVPAKLNNADLPAGHDGADSSVSVAPLPTALISDVPVAAAARPSNEALQSMIAAATQYALRYSKSLPNFLCMEVTQRSVDDSGHGNWKVQDRFADLLGYDGKEETRKLLETNGERAGAPRLNSSLPVSIGQFGGLLNLVFSPNAKTSFDWQGAALLGSDTVQVLKYVVDPEHASITLRASGRAIDVGFHGLLYVDAATGGIRRITLEADKIPADFPFHATAMMVEYGYVSIADHQYLLPTHASVSLQRGSRKIELNDINFRNYSRFASQTRIVVPQQ